MSSDTSVLDTKSQDNQLLPTVAGSFSLETLDLIWQDYCTCIKQRADRSVALNPLLRDVSQHPYEEPVTHERFVHGHELLRLLDLYTTIITPDLYGIGKRELRLAPDEVVGDALSFIASCVNLNRMPPSMVHCDTWAKQLLTILLMDKSGMIPPPLPDAESAALAAKRLIEVKNVLLSGQWDTVKPLSLFDTSNPYLKLLCELHTAPSVDSVFGAFCFAYATEALKALPYSLVVGPSSFLLGLQDAKSINSFQEDVSKFVSYDQLSIVHKSESTQKLLVVENIKFNPLAEDVLNDELEFRLNKIQSKWSVLKPKLIGSIKNERLALKSMYDEVLRDLIYALSLFSHNQQLRLLQMALEIVNEGTPHLLRSPAAGSLEEMWAEVEDLVMDLSVRSGAHVCAIENAEVTVGLTRSELEKSEDSLASEE